MVFKYSSKALYGPEYKPFNDEIKYQRLYLKNSFNDVLIDSLLDENYPLVFCELSGPAREQNDAEVKLVTDLVNQLWNSQVNSKSGKLAKDEGNFWRDKTLDNGEFLDGACGIITPHHEHINRLKTSISNNLNLNRGDIFIGTVDKLQGKERQAVIVSYGVSETEKIMNESEFIFSSNRFNVSITRGKAKTIIFLSEAIAEPNISTNLITANDKTLEKGIKFIHGFSAYMKECEEDENLVSEEYPDYYGNVSLKVWKKRLGSNNKPEFEEDDGESDYTSNLDNSNPLLMFNEEHDIPLRIEFCGLSFARFAENIYLNIRVSNNSEKRYHLLIRNLKINNISQGPFDNQITVDNYGFNDFKVLITDEYYDELDYNPTDNKYHIDYDQVEEVSFYIEIEDDDFNELGITPIIDVQCDINLQECWNKYDEENPIKKEEREEYEKYIVKQYELEHYYDLLANE